MFKVQFLLFFVLCNFSLGAYGAFSKKDIYVTKVELSQEDLYGQLGILYHDDKTDNRLKSGREWERLGSLSIEKNNKQLFYSPSGIRIHGGKSRVAPDPSFRAYLRKDYQSEKFPKDLLFSGESDPIKRLVIHRANDYITFFTNPIAVRLGCQIPRYEPSLFSLNDEYMGVYFLGERFNYKSWARHLKNKDRYFFVRAKNKHVEGDVEYPGYVVYQDLKFNWLIKKEKITYKDADKIFDLDNFIRHMFSIAFLGTTDWEQGAAVKDGIDTGRWFFINWDMEHSFIDRAAILKNVDINVNRKPWEQEGFALIMAGRRFHKTANEKRAIRKQDPRKLLFHRLWFESPKFREKFTKFARKALKKKLTQKYLDELYVDIEGMAKVLTPNLPDTFPIIKEFLRCRRSFIKERLEKVNEFPFVPWNGKTGQDHLDAYKHFEKLPAPEC